jgi:hypothetical protein
VQKEKTAGYDANRTAGLGKQVLAAGNATKRAGRDGKRQPFQLKYEREALNGRKGTRPTA